jgi:hypothetical protein
MPTQVDTLPFMLGQNTAANHGAVMAFTIAETTAAMPTIRAAMADGGAGGKVQRIANG